MMKLARVIFCLVYVLCAHRAIAQDSTIVRTFAFSVEEDLLSLEPQKVTLPKVQSLGIEAEPQLDLPYGVTVITAVQIEMLGLRTIPEALRLVPGMLVREITRDNYQVSLRGITHIHQSGEIYQTESPTLMLMINGSPWNNAFDGNINWNSIPLAMSDIESIEVVRVPMGVRFGLDAVEGSINIITKKATRSTLHGQANLEAMGLQDFRHSLSVEAGIQNRFILRLSAQIFSSSRTQNNYFHFKSNRWVGLDSLLEYQENAFEVANVPKLARSGYSLFGQLKYTGRKEGNASLVVFHSGAQDQTFSRELGGLNFVRRGFNYFGVGLSGDYKNFFGRAQFWDATVNHGEGFAGLTFREPRFSGEVGYENAWGALKVRGGVSVYDAIGGEADGQDGPSRSTIGISDSTFLVNRFGEMLVGDVFAQASYSLFENKLNFHAGVRVPTFGKGNSLRKPSFEAGATYRIRNTNALRVLYTRASGMNHLWSSFYRNSEQVEPDRWRLFSPDPKLAPILSQGLEIGYRGIISEQVFMDVEAFRYRIWQIPTVKLYDFSGSSFQEIDWKHSSISPIKQGVAASVQSTIDNFSMGYRLSLLFNQAGDLYTSLFENYLSAYFTYKSPLDRIHASLFLERGGQRVAVNYQGNLNLLPDFLRLNAYVAYQINPTFKVYVNAKNVFGSVKTEDLYGDPHARMLNAGLVIDL